MNAPLPELYEFGEFRLDPASHLLARRDGTPVPLTPRVFDTLLFLVQHSGSVLDKERLMEAIWPDSIVEENNLSQNISTLRRVLGESPGAHRYIDTVPGCGYRFVAEVRGVAALTAPQNDVKSDESTDALAGEPPATEEFNLRPRDLRPTRAAAPRKRWPVLLSALGVVVLGLAAFFLWPRPPRDSGKAHGGPAISEKSIAVLPFENLSHDPENAYFSDGIKDEILIRLSKVEALKVISRTSTQKFKSSPDNVGEIARQLGVANILEGSVQRSGETVRVTVQLIHAPSDTHLWAETYDRKMNDIFQVESEVAQRIVTALAATLSAPEKKALQARPTADWEVHQAYLKGRYFWNKRTREGFAQAGEYFEKAIALDPKYAAAYAGLSDAYQLTSYNVVSQPELPAKARQAARKALELDETLAEPHASLGLLAMNYEWDWATAEKEFRQAISLNSIYATAHHWYAEYLIAVGRPAEALAEIQRARELDPLSLIINTDTGKILYYARRYDAAIEQLRETLKLDPAFEQAHLWLGSVCATTGLYDEAIAEFARVSDNSWTMGWLGYVYAKSGQRDEAEKILTELRQMQIERPVEPHVLVCVYIGLGEKDHAFAALEREFEMHSVAMTSLKVNPWYDTLRSDPRFADLLRRTNLAP